MLELLVLKNLIQRTSQRVKWTSGARVMLSWMLQGWQKYAFRSIQLCKITELCKWGSHGSPTPSSSLSVPPSPLTLNTLTFTFTFASSAHARSRPHPHSRLHGDLGVRRSHWRDFRGHVLRKLRQHESQRCKILWNAALRVSMMACWLRLHHPDGSLKHS